MNLFPSSGTRVSRPVRADGSTGLASIGMAISGQIDRAVLLIAGLCLPASLAGALTGQGVL